MTARLPAQLRASAADRPGYGCNPQPAAGSVANARAMLDQPDSDRIQRAVLMGHSCRGGVALAAANALLTEYGGPAFPGRPMSAPAMARSSSVASSRFYRPSRLTLAFGA